MRLVICPVSMNKLLRLDNCTKKRLVGFVDFQTYADEIQELNSFTFMHKIDQIDWGEKYANIAET